MSSKPKIAIIIGSTRATRFADIPAEWMLAQAEARTDMTAELVDLRDFNLPMFNDMASNAYVPSAEPAAIACQKKLAEFDGYIFVVAEYNHSVTGSLKNALDQAYVEWAHKPVAAIAYGSMGGARALEHCAVLALNCKWSPSATQSTSAAAISGKFIRVWAVQATFVTLKPPCCHLQN